MLAAALNDEEPLGRIGTPGARQALEGRAGVEEDDWVQEELSLALSS